MMRVILALWLGVMGLAEPRIALIVGNGSYTAVKGLANPVSDAELKAGTLSGLGFAVRLVRDGTKAKMSVAVAEVGSALRAGGLRRRGCSIKPGMACKVFSVIICCRSMPNQGNFHVRQNRLTALETRHPPGGAFKLNLRRWAELGCQ